MRVRIALAASGLLLVLGTACDGGEPTPTTLPTPPSTGSTTPATATPTPTASPTPAAPTLPAAARADTPTGAESFARFWLQTLDYAYKTGDTKPFLALGTCASCTALANGINRHYEAGGRFEGGSFTAKTVQTGRFVKSSAALIDLVYSRAAGEAIGAAGERSPVRAETDVEFAVAAEWTAAVGWQAVSVKTVKR